MESIKSYFKTFFSKLVPPPSSSICEPEVDPTLPLYPPELNVVEREGWGAKPPVFDLPDDPLLPLRGPVNNVFYGDTASLMCDNLEECSARLQHHQWNHLDGGWPDITHKWVLHSFMIGTDGTVYVGRGWDWQPDAMWHNLIGDVIDITFIGNFERLYPLNVMIEAAETLIAHGVKLKKICKNNKVNWFRERLES